MDPVEWETCFMCKETRYFVYEFKYPNKLIITYHYHCCNCKEVYEIEEEYGG